MEELIKQIDLIHAEAIQTAEYDKMMKPDAIIIHEKHNKHIANIVKLRNMVTKAIDNMANQTTEDRGEYYLTGHEGHEQELIEKGLLKTK